MPKTKEQTSAAYLRTTKKTGKWRGKKASDYKKVESKHFHYSNNVVEVDGKLIKGKPINKRQSELSYRIKYLPKMK